MAELQQSHLSLPPLRKTFAGPPSADVPRSAVKVALQNVKEELNTLEHEEHTSQWYAGRLGDLAVRHAQLKAKKKSVLALKCVEAQRVQTFLDKQEEEEAKRKQRMTAYKLEMQMEAEDALIASAKRQQKVWKVLHIEQQYEEEPTVNFPSVSISERSGSFSDPSKIWYRRRRSSARIIERPVTPTLEAPVERMAVGGLGKKPLRELEELRWQLCDLGIDAYRRDYQPEEFTETAKANLKLQSKSMLQEVQQQLETVELEDQELREREAQRVANLQLEVAMEEIESQESEAAVMESSFASPSKPTSFGLEDEEIPPLVRARYKHEEASQQFMEIVSKQKNELNDYKKKLGYLERGPHAAVDLQGAERVRQARHEIEDKEISGAAIELQKAERQRQARDEIEQKKEEQATRVLQSSERQRQASDVIQQRREEKAAIIIQQAERRRQTHEQMMQKKESASVSTLQKAERQRQARDEIEQKKEEQARVLQSSERPRQAKESVEQRKEERQVNEGQVVQKSEAKEPINKLPMPQVQEAPSGVDSEQMVRAAIVIQSVERNRQAREEINRRRVEVKIVNCDMKNNGRRVDEDMEPLWAPPSFRDPPDV